MRTVDTFFARLRGAVPQLSDVQRTRYRWCLSAFGAAVFACMPQSQVEVPPAKPTSTLSIGALAEANAAPFTLVHAAPKGATTGDPSIQLVFSRPLRELMPDVPVPEGLVIAPAVAGHWEWVGAHGLTFVPEAGRLPRATRFQVRVPETLQDLAGNRLAEAVEFDFETPVAEVTGATPSRWGEPSRPETPVALTFSQPVAAAQVAPFVFAVVAGEALELLVEPTREANVVRVRARAGWPLASKVQYGVRPGFPSLEGPLPARKKFGDQFETYGPLFASVECARDERRHCRPEGGLSLSLSNPVNARALARAVRANGVKLHVDQDWESRATTRYISLGADLKPREQFTVIVDPIKDVYGQTLQFVRDRQVAVADLQPRVRIGFSGETLPTSEPRVAVLSTNAGYELVTAPLSADALLNFDKLKSKARYSYALSLPGAKIQRVPRGPLNGAARQLIELDQLTSSGPFLIGVRYQGERGQEEDVRWGQRTDLSMTIKAGRDRSFAWVTDLTTGAPLAGAEIGVLGSAHSVSTDAQGLAALPANEFVSRADKSGPAEWLWLRQGRQVAYQTNREAIGGWSLAVETDFYGEQQDLAHLFPERDLFRPGEQAWFKAYVRRPSRAGNVVLPREALELRLLSPDGEISHIKKVTTNGFGALAARLKIPRSGQLGQWSVELRRGEKVLANTLLQVAEFRPAEFTVNVAAREPSVIAGERVNWAVTGSYFYGGVMADAKLETVATRSRAGFTPPGLDDYETGDDAWQAHEPYVSYSATLESAAHQFDHMGELKSATVARLPHQVAPERIELEATVSDLSGQTATGRGSVLVHPAAYTVALKRPASTLFDAPGRLTPMVRAVTPQGKTASGRSVTLSLFRLRWTHVKRASGVASSETVREQVRDLVSTCALTTAAQDQGCELNVPEPGQYILRASSVDSKGRKTFSSDSFYAMGAGGGDWRDLDERGAVELTADRKMYEPGQSARILVKSPFQRARAWVTVEKDGVLKQKVVTANGASPVVQVKIEEAMGPNAYVSVHLVEDRKALGKKAHAIADSFRLGYVDLRVNPERQRLSVSAKADRAAYRPGEMVELALRVADHAGAGRAAEVAVFVVDEGVLTLSGYELPDPLSVFTQERPLRVETIESRQSVARLFGLEPNQHENKGAPGGGGGEDRAAMLSTAYFNPSIETDAGGHARARFKLPDNLGRFRVMALAVTKDDRYGKGQSSFDVNRPLMVRPALPRFLRSGDELELSAVVSSLGFGGGPVRVDVAAAGLSLLGPDSQTLTLEANSSKLVSFRARAPKTGQAKIRFVAAGQGEKDAVALTRGVQSPAQLEAVALYGKTTSVEAHRLGDLGAVRKDLGSLDVTLSSSALVGLKGGFEQLWDYPYLCSEQLSSRLMPLLMLRDLAALYGVSLPSDADSRIGTSLSALVRRQRGDGGFGMWPESPESSKFVSAYALWVLHEAKQRGRDVPGVVFQRGARYLQDVAAQRDDSQLPDAVFAAFTLGKIERGDKNTLNALFQLVEQMGVETQMMLLWAAADAGVPSLTAPLLARAEGSVTSRGNAAEVTAPHDVQRTLPLSSDLRRHAVTLNALLAAEPTHVLAAPLVRTLLRARKGGSWGSTQESAFALLGLDAYRRAQEKTEPEFDALVFLGGQLLGQKRFVGRSTQAQDFSVKMRNLASDGNLVFQRKGAGTLFFEARLQYARTELPKEALESGFMVQKTMTPLGGRVPGDAVPPRDANQASHGEMVLVELTVLTPSGRRFVVVEDPLPAGLEGLDMSLDNAQGSLARLLQPGGGGYGYAWYRSEMRDDRVLFFVDDMPAGVYRYRYLARATTRGMFVTPPARAMEMYQEEVYGRTGARSFAVR